jgi:hypothetical protein
MNGLFQPLESYGAFASRKADEEASRNALMTRVEGERKRQAWDEKANTAAEAAAAEAQKHADLGMALGAAQHLSGLSADPEKFSRAADALASTPWAQRLGLTREHITPDEVSGLVDVWKAQGATMPAGPAPIAVAAGTSLVRPRPDGTLETLFTGPPNSKPNTGFSNISPSDFSPRSLARYKASIDPATGQGDYSLLERVYSPQPGVNLMTPSEVAAAGLPTGTVAQVDERGKVNVVNKPEGGGAPNGEERSAAAFGNRMGEAEKFLSSPGFASYVPSTFTSMAVQKARTGGAITSSIGNSMLSQRDQQYNQYASDWIRAKLRKESGAAIGDQEMESEYRLYFPMPGDDPQTLEQKRQARLTAQQGFMQMAGRAAPSQPAPGGAPAGTPPSGQPDAAAPVRVRSIQEARRLKPGTWFITPTGEKLQSNGADYNGR